MFKSFQTEWQKFYGHNVIMISIFSLLSQEKGLDKINLFSLRFPWPLLFVGYFISRQSYKHSDEPGHHFTHSILVTGS